MNNFAISLIPPTDPVSEAMRLRLDVLDEAGNSLGNIVMCAADFSDDERKSLEVFAHNVEEEVRKRTYLQQFPVSEGDHNRESILREMREDFLEWYLRQRKGQERYEGIGDEAIREWRRHR